MIRTTLARRGFLRRRVLPTLLLLLALPPALASAQTSQVEEAPVDREGSMFELRRPDGKREVGWIVETRGDTITFETIEGYRLTADRRRIDLRPARGEIADGVYWPEDKNLSRLFFAPTGRTLREGQGYVGLFAILPFIGIGVTEDFTIASAIPFPWGGTLRGTPFYVAPKLRVSSAPGRQISTGAFLLHVPDWDDGYSEPHDDVEDDEMVGWSGVAYGVGTFGNDHRALHVGTGVTGGKFGVKVPVMVGGEYRISRKTKWITENWLVAGEGSAASVGLRRIGDRWMWDWGLMFLLSESDVPYLPIVSFSYAFGAGR